MTSKTISFFSPCSAASPVFEDVRAELAGVPPEEDARVVAQTVKLFNSGDPLFEKEDGEEFLRVRGPVIGVQKANELAMRELQKLNIQVSQLHGAQLVHGSSSASLLAFTEYGEREGCLLPFGELESRGKVPFCGELGFGCASPMGVNRIALSTVWVGWFRQALLYARGVEWSPVRSRNSSAAESFPSPSPSTPLEALACQVDERREAAWERLTSEEKQLVSQAFPVMYGIVSERESVYPRVASNIPGEVCLAGGALKREIKVIFVPRDKEEMVKDLFRRHLHPEIAVEPFDFRL